MSDYDSYQHPLVDRYAAQEMRALFSPQKRVSTWRRLWLALAEAEAELGLAQITDAALAEMHANLCKIDFEQAAEYDTQFRHAVMAHVATFGDGAPAGTVSMEGPRSMGGLVLDRETRRYRQQTGPKVADLVDDGCWFTPVREALSVCAEQIAQRLTGEVVVRLYKGSATCVQRRSEHSLYSADYATFGDDEVYDQSHAEGFIRLFSLPSRIANLKRKVAL